MGKLKSNKEETILWQIKRARDSTESRRKDFWFALEYSQRADNHIKKKKTKMKKNFIVFFSFISPFIYLFIHALGGRKKLLVCKANSTNRVRIPSNAV